MVDHYAAGADEQAPKVGACYIPMANFHIASDVLPRTPLYDCPCVLATRLHSSLYAMLADACPVLL